MSIIASVRPRCYDAIDSGGTVIQRPHRRIVLLRVLPRAAVVALATASILVVVLLCVCPAQATALRRALRDRRPGLVADGAPAKQDDFHHDLQVIANLMADPPAEPVVCLLGGSAARECTISEQVWAAQVQALGATALTYDLGWAVQTFAEEVWLMEALPSGQLDGIVFIGISVGGFTRPQTSNSFPLPEPVFPLPPWVQHLYSQGYILPVSKKRTQAREWMENRYPLFQANFSASRRMLEQLITVCKSRGLHPVLVETPRNMAIIGRTLDAPISRVESTCRALSIKYSIPFLSGFVGSANLANGDFYDLWHIVEPGRVKWQRLLSEKTAQLLQLYDLGSARSGVAQ
jgi:hypothetical protein